MIREAVYQDLEQLIMLYTQLHNNRMHPIDEILIKLWKKILQDDDQHILVYEQNQQIVSSCVLVIVPNLTQEQRAYALIENVITDEKHRGKGYASQMLEQAKAIAEQQHCYKIMLMTSSKEPSVWQFYERAGYNREDKTAFIQWLN